MSFRLICTPPYYKNSRKIVSSSTFDFPRVRLGCREVSINFKAKHKQKWASIIVIVKWEHKCERKQIASPNFIHNLNPPSPHMQSEKVELKKNVIKKAKIRAATILSFLELYTLQINQKDIRQIPWYQLCVHKPCLSYQQSIIPGKEQCQLGLGEIEITM